MNRQDFKLKFLHTSFHFFTGPVPGGFYVDGPSEFIEMFDCSESERDLL